MQSVHPYLNFNGNALEAFEFYRSVFGGEFLGVIPFRDFGGESMGMAEADLAKVAHIALPIAEGTNLMASDVVGPAADGFVVGTNTYTYLETSTAEEADRIFDALSAGGRVEMPLAPTAWAEKYGSCVDPFDVQWMISFAGDVRFEMPAK